MSSRHIHSHHRQPRPFLVPSQASVSRAPTYPDLYSNPAAGRYPVQTPGRQTAADPGFRSPFNMPNFSNMTNTALIDALLTPSANEQEHEHRALSLSTPFPEARTPARRGVSSAAYGNDLFEPSDREYPHEARRQPKRYAEERPKKQQKRNSASFIEADEGYSGEAQVSDDSSPQRARKPRRSNRPKKSLAPIDPPTPEEDDYPSPQKKSKPKRSSVAKKPKKARTGRLIRKKPVGTAVPKTLNEAGEADRMMWEWKNKGKNWEEIRAEWKRLTGVEPGGSSLSVRYIKLVENLARNGAAGDIELLKFKREAEEELLSQLWTKVAEKMLAYSPESEHNPKDLQKRYNMIVRSGYDVEQLIADDNVKRENESGHQPQHATASEYHGNLDVDLNALTAYNNPVANQTLARLRQPGASATDGCDNQPRYAEQGSSVPNVDPTDIFTRTRLLNQEVDGLNEHHHHDGMDYQMLGGHNMRYPASGTAHAHGIPFTTPNTTFRHHADRPYVPAASSLVDYGSDSE